MGEVLPRHYIIGIIMFTFVIVSGVSLLAEFNKSDSTFVDPVEYKKFNDTFNKYTEVTAQVDNMEESITNVEGEDYGILGTIGALAAAGWNTFTLLFSSFGFMEDAFSGLSTVFGVPTWVTTLIVALVTIMIIFAIYTAVFQREI